MLLLLAVAALQSTGGLSAELPGDEWLQFTFVRDPRFSSARITGTSPTATTWSKPALHRIVDRCGGRVTSMSRYSGRAISVRARSTANNVAIARCVQASTSLRFRATVAGRGFASTPSHEAPFRALWNS